MTRPGTSSENSDSEDSDSEELQIQSSPIYTGLLVLQGALLLTEGMQCWTRFDEVLTQLLSAVDSASVTFQCSAIRMFVDALLLYTSPSSSKLGIPAKQVKYNNF